MVIRWEGKVEAETLSISIPYKGCDKDCPYCISKMTGYLKEDMEVIMRNYPKVVQMAKIARVSKVIITGKGEPTLNPAMIKVALRYLSDFPIELNTNAIKLRGASDCRTHMLRDFANRGLNTLAISIDRVCEVMEVSDLIAEAKDIGLIPRIVVLVSDYLSGYTIDDFINECDADQFTISAISIPTNGIEKTKKALETQDWIKENVGDASEMFIKNSMGRAVAKGRLIRRLSYGPSIFEYRGISLSYFDRCIQENSSEENIRSIIFQEDGHLYYYWNSKAGIIF